MNRVAVCEGANASEASPKRERVEGRRPGSGRGAGRRGPKGGRILRSIRAGRSGKKTPGKVPGERGIVAGEKGKFPGEKGNAAGGKGTAAGGKGTAAGERGTAAGGKGIAAGEKRNAAGEKGTAAGGRGTAAGGRGNLRGWRARRREGRGTAAEGSRSVAGVPSTEAEGPAKTGECSRTRRRGKRMDAVRPAPDPPALDRCSPDQLSTFNSLGASPPLSCSTLSCSPLSRFAPRPATPEPLAPDPPTTAEPVGGASSLRSRDSGRWERRLSRFTSPRSLLRDVLLQQPGKSLPHRRRPKPRQPMPASTSSAVVPCPLRMPLRATRTPTTPHIARRNQRSASRGGR